MGEKILHIPGKCVDATTITLPDFSISVEIATQPSEFKQLLKALAWQLRNTPKSLKTTLSVADTTLCKIGHSGARRHSRMQRSRAR